MWNETSEKQEYIYDCDSLQLAVKVGIIGVLVGLAIVVITQVLLLTFFASSSYDRVLLSYELGILREFGFVGSILISLGYVGVFSMKNRNLGIVFPLIAIIFHCGFLVYLNILFQTGMYSSDIHIFSSYILTYVLAIISGLVLLTLRNVSANSRFLYSFAVFTIARQFLSDAIWIVISLLPLQIPINGGFVYLNPLLSSLIISLVSSVLVITFFLLESKNGCIEGEEFQTDTNF